MVVTSYVFVVDVNVFGVVAVAVTNVVSASVSVTVVGIVDVVDVAVVVVVVVVVVAGVVVVDGSVVNSQSFIEVKLTSFKLCPAKLNGSEQTPENSKFSNDVTVSFKTQSHDRGFSSKYTRFVFSDVTSFEENTSRGRTFMRLSCR